MCKCRRSWIHFLNTQKIVGIKFIQTFYCHRTTDPLKNSFGWASPEYHLMGWALGCLQLQQLHNKVDLYCNSKAAELLKNRISLPYSNVYTTHNEINILNDNLWALYKIFTYSLQDEPFLHIDGDVFLFKALSDFLLSSDLVAQNMEVATPEVYSNTQKQLVEHFTYFPNCVISEFANTIPIKAVNAGILGGSNISFIKEYARLAFEYVDRNKQHLSLINIQGFNVFFEQHLFYSFAKEKGVPITFLIKKLIEDDKYRHLGDFHEVPCKNNYLHLIGEYKRDEYTCRQMAAKLRELYPEYYYKIMSLCKTESASHTISLYAGKEFTDIKGYVKFNKKSKENYLNSDCTKIPTIGNKDDSATIHPSKTVILELLKHFLMEVPGLNDITKGEAEKDLKAFSKNVIEVLMRNRQIQNGYLYGRDLASVSWFCELFGNDSEIPNKLISKCDEVEIIKSMFDWGGLLNKITRVGIEYYEALKLESGEFYNLVVPELCTDGFSIEDLDEMEKIILEHLSEPSSIKDLFDIMQMYVEADIIKNHLDEYEQLIIVMLKQLVQKKAIRPFKNKRVYVEEDISIIQTA